MKKIKIFLCSLSLVSCLGLFGCSNNNNKPVTDNPSVGGQEDETPDNPQLTAEDKIFDTLKTLKKSPDYTLEIKDNITTLMEYFNKNVWSYDFSNSYRYTAYIEDETGYFPIDVSKSTGEYTLDYYEVNEYGENLHDLYANLTYSFSDLTLNEMEYEFDDKTNRLYLKDLSSEDSITLFSLLGYDPYSEEEGSSILDVNDIYFEYVDDVLTLYIDFDNETSVYGTATCKITDIGSTKQPDIIEKLIESNTKGYERVKSNDVLFEYLANLKNLRNFTSEVRSDYNDSYTNYTLISKYMKNAYYSVSSRPSEGDLGYYQDEDGIVELLVDGVTGKTIIGKNHLQDQYDMPLNDLYSDAIYSFASTTWDYTFKARVKDDSTYIIDDIDYISEIANMTDAYTLRLSFINVELSYDKNKNEYNFTFNMIENEKIYMKIYDINKTIIGDIPIE